MSLNLREFQHVFEASREGVLVVDRGQIRDANHAACTLLGYSHKQLCSLADLSLIVVEEDRRSVATLLTRTRPRHDAAPAIDLELLDRGGDPVAASLKAVRADDAWLLFILPRAHDDEGVDSMRKPQDRGQVRARTRELEESRNRYRTLVENLADGLITLNEHGEFLFVNRPFAAMLGYRARSRLVARHFLDFVVERDVERVRRGLSHWERGEVARFQASLRTREGEEVPVLLAGRALPRGEDGGYRGVLLLVTDFAERQALSERLALARKMDALSSLAGGIAHDFNNLLTGILGNASRIRLGSDDPEVDELARAVEDSAELAARLTQRLMALVRGQAPHRRLLDVSDLAAHTLGLLGKVMPETIELHTHFQRGLPPVLADESQLQQAILNLCINARDAMMEHSGGGRLTLRVDLDTLQKPIDDGTEVSETAVALTVADTGPGVPQKLRDRVFDPFFTTKGLGRGIGLGLATVYQLIDAHGGTVTVEDGPGAGAMFTLRLPAQPGRLAQEHSQPTRTLSEDSTGEGLILLAEDEDAIRQLVAGALEANGYLVLSARDGREAIDIWNERGADIDLLFLDVRMPHLDGPEVLRLARRDRPDVPAVFSSGFIPEESEADEVFEGVHYLPKPYRVPDLLEVVSSARQRRAWTLGGSTTDTVPPVEDVSSTEMLPVSLAGQTVDSARTLVDERPIVDLLDSD